MKKIIFLLVVFIICLITYYYKDEILVLYNKYYESKNFIPSELTNNEYSRNYNFQYVSLTDDFFPSNKQELLNLYYTVINSGMNEFTFYCKSEYENCINDVKDIGKNQVIVSNINNFVHPYNSFRKIETEIYSIGKVIIKLKEKNYDDEMKTILNYEIDKIIENNIKKGMTNKEKIKVIHDYIINNTKYDADRTDKNTIKYKSDTAYGAIVEGHSICSGYTDAMMLFLERLNIKSYKIASENHVWNYIYLDNKWYHLDLTWDDPVSSDGKDILEHKFFLINTNDLLKLDTSEHTFNKAVYSE